MTVWDIEKTYLKARSAACMRKDTRTTARDIVAASGTNLASIGYHYGSTEALLQAAMIRAIEEWGEKLERALAVDIDPQATPWSDTR